MPNFDKGYPMISVIMLTYNRENLLGCAIESILAQTFTNFEFIIVDNGSSDESGKIADKYAASDDRICVIHCEKGNIGSGRNIGLDKAAGRYIAFIDDDDYCEPDFLEFLYEMATEYEADIAICGSNFTAVDEKVIMNAEDAIKRLLWRKHYNVAFPTKLIARGLFDNNRFKGSGKYDDIYLMPKILANANKIAYYGLPKYTFYRHDSNNSAWTTDHSLINSEILSEYLDVYRQRTKWLSELFADSVEVWKYFEWSFMLSMIEKITRLNLKDCYAMRDAMSSELSDCRNELYNSEYLMEFEKSWLEEFI